MNINPNSTSQNTTRWSDKVAAKFLDATLMLFLVRHQAALQAG